MSALQTQGSVFRHRAFRLVFGSGLLVYLATWLSTVAAAWLMTQLSTSAFMVALIQTAGALPFLLLSLPAGVLADVMDRRRVMLVVQLGNVLVCLVLAVLAATHMLGPWGLVALTAALGALLAVHGPASQATVADVVPREELHAAMAWNGISFNLARSAGPGLAGLVLALAGAPFLYVLTALAFVLASLALYRLSPMAPAARALPPERLGAALQAGFRYARHAPPLRAVLVRSSLFAVWGSALWALLPLVAKDLLGGGAAAYGVLIACLGAGAVAGGLLLSRIRAAFPLDRSVSVAAYAFAAVTLLVANLQIPWLIYAVLVIGGAAWMTCNTLLFTLAQTNVPAWVRARASGLLLVIFQGGMALGAMFWGAVASHFSTSTALTLAAVCTLPLYFINRRFELKAGTEQDVTPAAWTDGAWSGPVVDAQAQVAVEVRYQIATTELPEFLAKAPRLGPARRRNGAVFWRLFKEVESADTYVERFIVDSWLEYERQQSRSTVSDEELLAELERLKKPGTSIVITHYLVVAG
jgi:MFS family permease